jgi:hypothetical protein
MIASSICAGGTENNVLIKKLRNNEKIIYCQTLIFPANSKKIADLPIL